MSIEIEKLKMIANEIRGNVIQVSHKAKIPHLGSCLSCVDILVAAYWGVLNIDPLKARDPMRDRFILSKGHGAPAYFQVLARKGFFPTEMLNKYGEDGGIFAEHTPTPEYLNGIEAATGSLGHGLSIAAGMALAGRIQKQDFKVYALLSDGECEEGSVWEAALFAAARKLDRLAIIIDYNKWQATGRSEEVMALKPLKEKWEAFGWSAYETNGHDIENLIRLMVHVPDGSGKPIAIIANTIKGKGVSFMEDDNNWHYKIPSTEEVAAAYKELGLVP